MVLSRRVAKFNRRVTNQVLGKLTPVLPGFGTIVHTGRRSGRTYRTPVNLFRTSDGYRVALTYGPQSDWVRNILAADGCDAIIRGKQVHLDQPRVVHDPGRKSVPPPARQVLGVVGVVDFLELHRA